MPLWPLLTPVLRFALSNVDFRFLYDRLAASRVRRVPNTRAHVVDALNAVLPAARATWTPQSLFLFIAAFAKVDIERTGVMRIEWLRRPETIVAYIVRGLTTEVAATLNGTLLEECDEVFETLVAIAPQARRVLEDTDRASVVGPRSYARMLGRINEQQQRMRDRKIAALLANALLHGGLSTNECRHLLISHEISARDVDAALRSPATGK